MSHYRDPEATAHASHTRVENTKPSSFSTADGDCELTVSMKDGQLIAEATVHHGDCWFRYQRLGGDPRPEARVNTGWQFVTSLVGTYDFDLRSNEDSTSYTVTLPAS